MGYAKYFEDIERLNSERENMAAKNILESLRKFENHDTSIPGLKNHKWENHYGNTTQVSLTIQS